MHIQTVECCCAVAKLEILGAVETLQAPNSSLTLVLRLLLLLLLC